MNDYLFRLFDFFPAFILATAFAFYLLLFFVNGNDAVKCKMVERDEENYRLSPMTFDINNLKREGKYASIINSLKKNLTRSFFDDYTCECSDSKWKKISIKVIREIPLNSCFISDSPKLEVKGPCDFENYKNYKLADRCCKAIDVRDACSYRDDKDCSVYYECTFGKPVKMPCPSTLVFDEKLQVCNYPYALPPSDPCSGNDY